MCFSLHFSCESKQNKNLLLSSSVSIFLQITWIPVVDKGKELGLVSDSVLQNENYSFAFELPVFVYLEQQNER